MTLRLPSKARLMHTQTQGMTPRTRSLEQFAQAGQIDDDLMNGSDKTFAKLETTPQYRSLMQKLRSNKAAISKAEPVFTLADSGLVA